MDTIRGYLESMFANLPNTPDVQKAKAELSQMMEDKYTELREEGRSENEAVGVVIAEFGNLEELSDVLGIRGVVQKQAPVQGRFLRMEEVRAFLESREKNALLVGIGVLLCIISPITFLMAGAVSTGLRLSEAAQSLPMAIALAAFFILIGIAIALFIYPSATDKWTFLKREPVSIDYATAEYLEEARAAERPKSALRKTIGILLIVFCFVPLAVIGVVQNEALDREVTSAIVAMFIGAIVLFLLVGIGVLLLVAASGKEGAIRELLRVNDRNTISGHYVPAQQEVRYENEKMQRIMDVYWSTVLCVYLCWSFLSFDWHITWIVWPIAAIVKHWLESVWGIREEKNA